MYKLANTHTQPQVCLCGWVGQNKETQNTTKRFYLVRRFQTPQVVRGRGREPKLKAGRTAKAKATALNSHTSKALLHSLSLSLILKKEKEANFKVQRAAPTSNFDFE